MLSQAVQVVGSLLVLLGFVLLQRGLLDQRSVRYLVANFIGSALLAGDAVYEQQWGFLILEGVWALVSGVSLLQVTRRRAGAPPVAR